MINQKRAMYLLLAAIAASPGAQAEDEKHYANAPNENATDVYFGDAHVHTVMSMDAAAWGTTQTPDDSYRYAKGEEVTSFKGWKTQLTRPLDWLVIADHSDGYDFYNMVKNGDPLILKEELGRLWNEMLTEGGEENNRFVADDLIKRFGGGDEMPWDVADPALLAPGWETTVAAAEAANDPGQFTAFIGYEWSSAPGGDNLHRVVIYRDDGDKASQTLPLTMSETKDPEDLWKSLQAYEDKTGGKVLAIAHNGNWSSGQMFAGVKMNGKPLDEAYAKTRMRWEPVYENTQIKGDGETHPLLSPDDEFADFETWDVGNLSFSRGVTIDMLPTSYSRSALKLGLQHEAKIGTNPFQFGQIGAGDSQRGLSGTKNNNAKNNNAGIASAPNIARQTSDVKIQCKVLPSVNPAPSPKSRIFALVKYANKIPIVMAN